LVLAPQDQPPRDSVVTHFQLFPVAAIETDAYRASDPSTAARRWKDRATVGSSGSWFDSAGAAPGRGGKIAHSPCPFKFALRRVVLAQGSGEGID
jgi:hypothetical protein